MNLKGENYFQRDLFLKGGYYSGIEVPCCLDLLDWKGAQTHGPPVLCFSPFLLKLSPLRLKWDLPFSGFLYVAG